MASEALQLWESAIKHLQALANLPVQHPDEPVTPSKEVLLALLRALDVIQNSPNTDQGVWAEMLLQQVSDMPCQQGFLHMSCSV